MVVAFIASALPPLCSYKPFNTMLHLVQHSAHGFLRKIGGESKLARSRVTYGHGECAAGATLQAEQILQLLKLVSQLRIPISNLPLPFCLHAIHVSGQPGKLGEKFPIVPEETQGRRQLLGAGRLGPLPDICNKFVSECEPVSGHSVPKVIHCLGKQYSFLRVDHDPCLKMRLKHFLQEFKVFLNRFSVEQNVVKVGGHARVLEVVNHGLDQPAIISSCVLQSERHPEKLKKAKSANKSCHLGTGRVHTQVVVGLAGIEATEHFGPSQTL